MKEKRSKKSHLRTKCPTKSITLHLQLAATNHHLSKHQTHPHLMKLQSRWKTHLSCQTLIRRTENQAVSIPKKVKAKGKKKRMNSQKESIMKAKEKASLSM